MNNMNTIDEFLSSEIFSELCNEGIQDENSNAMELIKMIDMCVESMTFFAKIDERNRFNREMEQLLILINYIKKIYEQQ